MRRVHFLAISALILLVLCGRCLAQIPKLEFEKYHLPNGLQVILHQDHSTPIVAVNIWLRSRLLAASPAQSMQPVSWIVLNVVCGRGGSSCKGWSVRQVRLYLVAIFTRVSAQR